MTLTARELARQRKQTRREMERDLKIRERAKLATLREHIQHAKRWRAARMPQIRAICRAGKKAARELAKVARARLRAELKIASANAALQIRNQARIACEARKDKVRAKAADSVARALAVFGEERAYQQQLHRLEKPVKLGPKRRVTTRAEYVRESDDEVRGNIPAELVPVFDKMRHKFKDEPRRTRTEAFMEWAHDHPADVRVIVDAEIEASIAELIAAEQEQRAAMRTPARSLSNEALERRHAKAAMLEAVPF
jgi:hypothetical protein